MPGTIKQNVLPSWEAGTDGKDVGRLVGGGGGGPGLFRWGGGPCPLNLSSGPGPWGGPGGPGGPGRSRLGPGSGAREFRGSPTPRGPARGSERSRGGPGRSGGPRRSSATKKIIIEMKLKRQFTLAISAALYTGAFLFPCWRNWMNFIHTKARDYRDEPSLIQ